MKIRKTKKGFTIVELVIVIAVIGILAAILIPTFVGLNNRANEASDNSLVNNLNKALKVEEGTAGQKPATFHEAIEGLQRQGYLLANLSTKSGKELVWNQDNNQFILNPENSTGANYWEIVNSLPAKENQKHSYYAGAGWTDTVAKDFVYGFDSGTSKYINEVEYKRPAGTEQVVIVRTNGGVLKVDAPSDSLKHYGSVNELTVTSIKTSSYHEYGVVNVKATLINGKVNVEKDGYIREVDTTSANAGSSLVVDGYISKVTAAAGEAAIVPTAGNGYVAEVKKGEAAPVPFGSKTSLDTEIANLNDLLKFKAKVNDGYNYAGLTVKLIENIDVSGVAWEPIGKKANPFVGTFDGQGHIISGLTNGDYDINANDEITPSTYSGNVGGSYGFFGTIGGPENTTTTIKNLTLANVSINTALGKNVGGLFGSDAMAFDSPVGSGGDITIQGIKVSGQIISSNTSGVTIGGIAGKVYNTGTTVIKNCENEAKLTAIEATKDVKLAGILGFFSDARLGTDPNFNANVIIIDNCKNYGEINAKTTYVMTESDVAAYDSKGAFVSGIVSKSWGQVYIKDCITQGKFTLDAPYAETYFSPIARLQNHDVVISGETTLDDVTYTIYQAWVGAPTIYGSNCRVTNDEGRTPFSAKIVSDKYNTTSRELGYSDFENDFDKVFYYFDSRPAMPWAPYPHP